MQPSLISHPPGKSPSQSWSLPPPSTQHRRYSTRQEERKLPPHISHLTAKRALKRRLHKTPIALPFRFLLLFPHLRSQGRHFPPRIMYISCRCRATIRRNHHHWPPKPLRTNLWAPQESMCLEEIFFTAPFPLAHGRGEVGHY